MMMMLIREFVGSENQELLNQAIWDLKYTRKLLFIAVIWFWMKVEQEAEEIETQLRKMFSLQMKKLNTKNICQTVME